MSPIGAPLRRSTTHRDIAGVLGGIAAYFELSVTRLRVAFVVVSVLSAGFPGILTYLALWYVIPSE